MTASATGDAATATQQLPSRRSLLCALGSLSAVAPMSMDMYLPGLPALTRDLHTSASAAQLTITGCMLGIALGQLVAGPLSDARGRRLPLLIGTSCYMVTSLACVVAPDVLVLLALRLLQGAAGGFGIVIARAVVRDLYHGAAAARAFATLMLVNGVAPVLAPVLGGQLLHVTDWRGVFGVLTVLGLCLLLGTLRLIPETLPPDRRHTGGMRQALRTFRLLLADRGFAPYAVAYALSFGAMFAYIAGSSYVLENVFKTSPQVFSLVFGANSLGLVAMIQVRSRLVVRQGPAPIFRLGVLGCATAATGVLLVTALHAELAPLLICLFLLVCFEGLVLPSGVAAAMADHPEALGSASALLGLGQFGLGATVAPLVGLAGAHDAVPMGILMAVCALSAAAINLLFS